MSQYNLTNLSNANGVFEMTQAVSDASGGVLGLSIILMVACITFLSLKNYSTKSATLVSTFFTAVVTMMLYALQWVGGKATIITMIICAAAFVAALVYKDG